jgi:hypothetical protein
MGTDANLQGLITGSSMGKQQCHKDKRNDHALMANKDDECTMANSSNHV